MPLPRLLGLGIEKILLLLEQFFGKAVPDFFCFGVEGGNKSLCPLSGTYWSAGLDSDNWSG